MNVRMVNKRSKKQGNAHSMILFISSINKKCNTEVGLKDTFMGVERQNRDHYHNKSR